MRYVSIFTAMSSRSLLYTTYALASQVTALHEDSKPELRTNLSFSRSCYVPQIHLVVRDLMMVDSVNSLAVSPTVLLPII